MKTIIRLSKFYYRLVGKRLCLLLFLAICAVGFQGLGLSLFIPILQGEAADNKISRTIKSVFVFFGLEYSLLCLLLFLLAFFILRAVFLISQTLLADKIIAELLVNLRYKIADMIFNIDYQAYLKKSSGYLNNALVVEFNKVTYSFKIFSNLVATILSAAMYIGFSLFLNPFLVLVLIGIGIPFYFVIRFINKITKDNSIATSKCSAGLQNVLIQSLNYFKYLKATSAYPKVLDQILYQSKRLGRLQIRQSILGAITQYGFEPLVVFVIAGVIFYYAVMQGEGIIGKLFLLYLLYGAMSRILGAQGMFRKSLDSWGSINVLENLELELNKEREIKPIGYNIRDTDFRQLIRLEHVGFSFHNGVQVLKDINIDISPDSTVAFVGDSGAGKTTLVNILIGLLLPTKGDIFVGKIPYRDINRDSIRKGIGYITQENVIFNDSIYNNITLWEPRGSTDTMKLVKSVCQKAYIDKFIDSLKDGYDTVLGEGGIDISGGQRQRICIARELFKDTRVIIFDEATSSLDTKTEKEIQRNIDEFKGQKTIILVAHRLSTVRNADEIYVLKNGTIVERGTYMELYNLNGEFRKIIDQHNS